MCGGVEISGRYTRTGKQLNIYFPNPRAALPVLCSDGSEVAWVPWGRMREQVGKGPAGGWARLSSIEEGRWQKDEEKVSHWFELADSEMIEGLVVGPGEQQRVYVITTEPPRGLE